MARGNLWITPGVDQIGFFYNFLNNPIKDQKSETVVRVNLVGVTVINYFFFFDSLTATCIWVQMCLKTLLVLLSVGVAKGCGVNGAVAKQINATQGNIRGIFDLVV